MNTTDLVERIATEHDLTKTQARGLVEAVFKSIIEAAAGGDEVALSGFGRFKVADRPARQGRNPATGETIEIPASRKLAFAAAKAVRDHLNMAGAGTAKSGAKPSPAKRPAAAAVRSGPRRVART